MCAYFAAFGKCKYGNECKFPHAPVTDTSKITAIILSESEDSLAKMWESAGPRACHRINSVTLSVNPDPCPKTQTPQVSAMKRRHETGDDSNVVRLCGVRSVGRVMRGQKWNMDSGAMVHVCNNKKSMFDVEKVMGNQSLMCADGRTKCRVYEKGKIKLQNGIVLSDVFYCPSWKAENYVSMYKMIMENYEFHMKLVSGVPTMSILKDTPNICPTERI